MTGAISKCSSLIELNLNNFNTINVTDMPFMFFRCSALKELNIDNFIFNNVKSMSFMFSDCSSLKDLNMKLNFTTNIKDYIDNLFSGCSYELIMKIKNQQ